MDIWDEIKKLSGYQSGNGGVDSYGVDHSGFSTRDELEYQSARLARENQLAENFSKQGIAEENYPQFGTNFWGGTPENNYGFGTSNIKQNIENVTNQLNNNTNNGQVTTNSDYTVNTESLVGKPSSYFQNNNSVGGVNNQIQDNLSNPNCYVEFDGQNVDLYKYGQYDGNRLQNGQLQDDLNGQSGGDDYQSRIHQDVPNKGPIPEGTYYADQDQRQNITALDAVWGGITKVFNLPYGHWKGSLPAWGTSRVWLRPDDNTNTYGRSGFSIHGGLTKGSAGCIDIPWQTGKLNNYLDGCQDSVPVYVKYPKDW